MDRSMSWWSTFLQSSYCDRTPSFNFFPFPPISQWPCMVNFCRDCINPRLRLVFGKLVNRCSCLSLWLPRYKMDAAVTHYQGSQIILSNFISRQFMFHSLLGKHACFCFLKEIHLLHFGVPVPSVVFMYSPSWILLHCTFNLFLTLIEEADVVFGISDGTSRPFISTLGSF